MRKAESGPSYEELVTAVIEIRHDLLTALRVDQTADPAQWSRTIGPDGRTLVERSSPGYQAFMTSSRVIDQLRLAGRIRRTEGKEREWEPIVPEGKARREAKAGREGKEGGLGRLPANSKEKTNGRSSGRDRPGDRLG